MSATPPQTAITLSPADLEALVRRVVREVLREELARLARRPVPSILDDASQEGPDDPAGDEALLADAMAALEQYENDPAAWMKWEDFKTELARAEAAGELPD